jgi:hypothetical protein
MKGEGKPLKKIKMEDQSSFEDELPLQLYKNKSPLDNESPSIKDESKSEVGNVTSRLTRSLSGRVIRNMAESSSDDEVESQSWL